MLWRLSIDKLALIEKADLEFSEGFAVISGETGAGKSLLLGAIAAISGAYVTKDLIRSGADTALAEGVFIDVKQYFAEDEEVLSYFDEEDELILSREIRRNGRNLCRVNGRMVSMAFLRRIGDRLVDIHGQNDRQQIFRAERHLAILDRFGGKALQEAKNAYRKAYKAACELAKKEKELLADPEERELLCDRLRYQIHEIRVIDPQEDEDLILAERRNLLANQEKLKKGLAAALHYLSNDDDNVPSAAESLALAYDELYKLSPYSEKIRALSEEIDRASEVVHDSVSALYTLTESMDDDGGELEKTDRRLDQITRLKRKYGGDIAAVRAFAEKAEQRLEAILKAAESADALKEKRRRVNQVLQERGLALREERRKAAEVLSKAIGKELAELGMEQAEFRVHFKEKALSQAGPEGLEQCEFLLSANRGEALKPLAQTASGGEASRIMLAIKVILAEADNTPLLIFDEIDAGISGKTSAVVAAKLKRLSQSHQIICVSHQAQIAAKADTQFLIYKESDEERTRTYIRPLNAEERVSEIARLLSGNKDDAGSRALAERLLTEL